MVAIWGDRLDQAQDGLDSLQALAVNERTGVEVEIPDVASIVGKDEDLEPDGMRLTGDENLETTATYDVVVSGEQRRMQRETNH